jgi:hypothetical protein
VQAAELFHNQEQAKHHRPAGTLQVLPLVPQAYGTPGNEMTHDQFPMPNGAAQTVRIVTQRRAKAISSWSLAIGIWSLPGILRERVREESGIGL